MSSIENQYTPDHVSPPGETLEEALDERGMTQVDFAQRIGMSRKHLKQILDGAAPITPGTALKFERVLGVPARFWNNREQHYRDFLARRTEGEELESCKDWLGNFRCLSQMKKLGWLPETQGPVETLRALLNFYRVASPDAWEAHWGAIQVHYRRSLKHEPDVYALAAWLRRGEMQAREIDCKPYDEAKFRFALLKARGLTLDPPEVFQPQLVELCAVCGVTVVFVPELPRTASGATRWLSPSKALIQLGLKYRKNDHFWFTFFHGAGHILLHPKKDIFIETQTDGTKEEEEANKFAARILIPEVDFAEYISLHPSFTKTVIERFAQRQGIAPGIVVGRLQNDGILPYTQCNELKRTLDWHIQQNETKVS